MKHYLIRFIACVTVVIDLILTAFVMYKITDPFAWWIVMLVGMFDAVVLTLLWEYLTEIDGIVYRRRYVYPETYADDDDEEEDEVPDETFEEGLERIARNATETYPAWLDMTKSYYLQRLIEGFYPEYRFEDEESRQKAIDEVERIDNDSDIPIYADMFDADLNPLKDKFEDDYKRWREDLRIKWFAEYGAYVEAASFEG